VGVQSVFSKLVIRTILVAAAVCCLPQLHAQASRPSAQELQYADAYADHYEVPRPLVHAVIRAESDWNRVAVSSKGALGVMQLMPGTAREFGVRDPFSISQNISAGVRYLAQLIREFGDYRLAIAAYDCGAGPIRRYGLEYANPEVSSYVATVRRFYQEEVNRDETNHTRRP
jgi:soluble lytic murein transglycosylase-like protein